MVSPAQAVGWGLSPTVIRRLLLEGRWGRFDAGLYLVPDIDPTWRSNVLIELDGRIGHVGEGMWRDRRRDNAHARLSQLTLRYGWQEVCDEPCAIALEVFEVLISRGCGGYPDRCGRCAG